MKKLLLFGGSGTLGEAICSKFEKEGWNVWVSGRSQSGSGQYIGWDVLDCVSEEQVMSKLCSAGTFDAVCWSQGMNMSDSIFDFQDEAHVKMYEANVLFVIKSLNVLLSNNFVSSPAKFCVVSSIWQNISRQNKLSYSVTKSALKGLVLSLSNDLAKEGHLINAVLPGAIETPMTRENLSNDQIKKIETSTHFNKLVELEDVSNAVFFTCSPLNTGVTGNFITVDFGFSYVRNL